MNKWRDFLQRQFLEMYHAPTAFRGWKSLLSGLKVGSAMSATHLMVLLCFSSFIMLCYDDSSFRQFFSGGSFGNVLVLSSMFGLFVTISLAAPFYMFGVFDGGRWRGYFDQIVVTGVSPLRYVSGQMFSGFANFLLMSLSMIPYLVFGETFGFGGWLWFCYAVLLILLWGVVLMFLFTAFAVYFHEVLSFILVCLFAIGFGILSIVPTPGLWGGITPVRYLILPVFSSIEVGNSSDFAIFEFFYRYVFLGYWQIPIALYTPIVYAVIIFLCYRILLVGPRHLALPGSNNLGVVCFPGDSKRRGFWRLRWNLKRQIDRYFFFENSACSLSAEEKENYRRTTRLFILHLFIFLFVLGMTGRFWEYLPGSASLSVREVFEIRSFILCIVVWPVYYFFSLRARNEFVPVKQVRWKLWDHYFEFVYYFFFPLIILPLIIFLTPYCNDFFLGSTSSRAAKIYDYWAVLFGTFLVFPYLWSIHLFGRWVATYTYSKVIVFLFMFFYFVLSNLFILLGIVILQEFFYLHFYEPPFFPLYAVFPDNIDRDRLTTEAFGMALLFFVIDILLISFTQNRIKRIQKNLD